MNRYSRRNFLRKGLAGLAVFAGGGLVLSRDAFPTERSGGDEDYIALLEEEEKIAFERPRNWNPTEDNIQGPFYRKSAPYRAKISPPLASGTVMVISGRVWGYDSKKPLQNAMIDIWHADDEGHYDNDGSSKTPPILSSINRARALTDESGYYEYETIHPAPYQLGRDVWRPSHIHYLVRHPGYKDLITQLYFRGDSHQDTDAFIKESLIIELQNLSAPGGSYQIGVFDIVLEPA